MIKQILLALLLTIVGGILTAIAQTDVDVKTRITLHNSIFKILDKPGKSQYKSDEKFFAMLELINESSKEKWTTIGQQWRYLRPKLIRDGKIVLYKTEIQELLRAENPSYSPIINITLKPKVATQTDNVHLYY